MMVAVSRGPVVERESQLAALRSYAEQARSGQGRIVLVCGEAGVGKSTLLERFTTQLGEPTWWGACDGLSTPRPLGPLADIAGQAGGALAQVCAGGASRDEQFDALVRALREGPRPSGVQVVVVEDLHWADEATLDMLRFLGRRIRPLPVLVIATYRDDALAPDEPLRLTLGDLATHAATRRIVLGPLSQDAVGALAVGSGIDGAALHAWTGGNPFFVGEVLSSGTLGVPGSARDVVLARAAGLPVAARAVLDHAALLGARVPPAVLSACTGATPDLLDALLTSGMLVSDEGQLRFRHEIARQAVITELPAHRAVQVHRALLEALRAAGCRDDARLAFHAEGAGDGAGVVEHAARAGRVAADLSSHREAAAQFERAVRHAGAAEPAVQAQLYDDLATELALVERWEETAQVRAAAVERWRTVGDRIREGAAQTQLGTALWRLCRGEESTAAFRRARERLAPLGPSPALCDLYAVGADATDPDTIAGHILEAVEMAAALALPRQQVRALNGLGYLAACTGGDYEAPLREALRIALDHGLQQQVGLTYANLTEYLAADFRFVETEPLFHEALDYCAEHDVSTFGNCVRGHYALALLDQARHEEALRYARETLATKASPINRLTSLVSAGLVLARRGDPAAAGHLAEAVHVAVGVAEPGYVAMARLATTEAAWLADDPDAARHQLRLLGLLLSPLQRRQKAAVLAWQKRLGPAPDEVPAPGPYAVQVMGPPRRAAETWDALGMPYHAALALADSDDEGDLRAAVGRLDAPSPAAARVVRRRMRTLGLRAVPAGANGATRSDPHGLTRREREVLELVAQHLTNEQIAHRLTLSVRTVHHHISAVLTKLGVASRREAARLASGGPAGVAAPSGSPAGP